MQDSDETLLRPLDLTTAANHAERFTEILAPQDESCAVWHLRHGVETCVRIDDVTLEILGEN